MQGSDDARAAVTRREFLKRSAVGGVGVLTFTIAGRDVLATPAEARVAGALLRFLESSEAAVLERLGEALVPGSAAAGLVHYVDHQLAGPTADCMLMAKYLGLAPPLGPFYRGALTATRAALARYDADPAYSTDGAPDPARAAAALAAAMLPGKVEGWEGPPAGLVCFVLRTDAIDVAYGTPEGFERLGVPYMAHIHPASRWGA